MNNQADNLNAVPVEAIFIAALGIKPAERTV